MKLKLSITRRTYLFHTLLIGIGVMLTTVFIQVTTPQVAHAWCSSALVDPGILDRENIDENSSCAQENWDSIPHNSSDGTKRRGMSYEDYMKAIDACAGDTAGWDAFETTCADAISNCLQYSLDAKLCSNAEKMADVASRDCEYGRQANCNDINESNQAIINKAQDDVTKKALESCDLSSVSGSSVTAINNKRKECEQRYRDEMIKKGCINNVAGLNTSEHRYNEIQDGLNKASSCMNDALKTSATTASECKNRGGIWQDNETGTGNNTVSIGCYANYSDLTNEDACKAAGGKWERTGGGTHGDDYGCKPPDGKNNDNTPVGANGGGTATGVDGSVAEIKDHCGQVRVNLLACGDEQGAGAFNNVLKIILQVLTVLVGVAAVGGLAYASITYARAEDNASLTGEAKTLIRNIVIGILLYGFLIAIVSWLVPGLSIL